MYSDLLPRVVWLGRTVEQRYKAISSVGDTMSSAAAAAAIHFGKFDPAISHNDIFETCTNLNVPEWPFGV